MKFPWNFHGVPWKFHGVLQFPRGIVVENAVGIPGLQSVVIFWSSKTDQIVTLIAITVEVTLYITNRKRQRKLI